MNSANGNNRHAACIDCRQRKVRCDGGQPCCKNCARRGADCVYVRHQGQDKQEMIVMIKELSEPRAEKALATKKSPTPVETGTPTLQTADPILMNWDDTPFSFDAHQLQPATSHSPEWQLPESTNPTHDAAFPVAESLSHHATQQLYDRYFEKGHNGCFMLDKERFMSAAGRFDARPEFQALRLIVVAHGASISPEYSFLAGSFYEQAHQLFEHEVETRKGFATVTALQACVLLALYELKQTLFSRAWASISRACWMAQMFGLHVMDYPQSPPKQQQRYLPKTSDSRELEERRRTFWSTYILSCFANVSVGWNTCMVARGAEITTYLPAAEVYDAPSRLTLADAFRMSSSSKLSITQALVVTSVLYGRCLVHIEHAQQGSPGGNYDFWMHHYHISESVHHLSPAAPAVSGDPSTPTEDASLLCLRLNMQAVKICLHYAAIVRASSSSSMAHAAESNSRCVDAAMDVAGMTRIVLGQADMAHMSPFVPWFLYIAAQACIRALHLSARPAQQTQQDRHYRPRSSSAAASSHHSSLPATPGGSGFPTPSWEAAAFNFGGSGSDEASLFSLPNTNDSTINNTDSSSSSYALLTDSIHSLLAALEAFKLINPIAGVFAAQLHDELGGGKGVTDERSLGRADFPLDGSARGSVGSASGRESGSGSGSGGGGSPEMMVQDVRGLDMLGGAVGVGVGPPGADWDLSWF